MDAGDATAGAVEQDVDQVALDVEGVQWTVQVQGRSRVGPTTAPTDMMLLGFSGPGEDPTLERLVVGRTLSGLTERELFVAFASAMPPLDPKRPRTLFAGAAERRSRKG